MRQLLRNLRLHSRNLLGKKLTSGTQPEEFWQEIMLQSKAFLSTYQHVTDRGRVLCATSVGGNSLVRVVDSLVAMGLWLRGADVQLLLCDRVLPACEAAIYTYFSDLREFARFGPSKSLCIPCSEGGTDFYRPLPVTTRFYSEFVGGDDTHQAIQTAMRLTTTECFRFVWKGMPLGEQAQAGVLRFFGKATFEDEDPAFVEAVARRYLAGALLTAQMAERAIDVVKPDCIVAHHGVYVPQGVLGIVARKKGVRVVNWGPSYRNTTVIYSHGDTYHHTFMHEPTPNWERLELTPERNRTLEEYLLMRRGGRGDWSWVTPDRGESATIEEHTRLTDELGLDIEKPIFGLLTNVLWDAQLYYANPVFSDMLDWLFTTLDHFVSHPELQLVVRIHPHEIKSGNRQPTGPEIARRYPALPDNIRIVDRDSRYSTYALMDMCQAVLIYGTKTGVELAPFGVPVIVAADAWIRNKGISVDITSREEYLALLDRLPAIEPLSPQDTDRARRYAYHYFFRRMIPLHSLDPDSGYPPALRVTMLEELLPGHDEGLDVICNGILTGQEFVYEPA